MVKDIIVQQQRNAIYSFTMKLLIVLFALLKIDLTSQGTLCIVT